MTLGDNSLEIMLHPFNIHFFLSRPKIHYCSCDLGHRRPFPTITNLKSPPGKSFTPSMNIAPDQTIILGLQIILDHRSLSSIDHCNKFFLLKMCFPISIVAAFPWNYFVSFFPFTLMFGMSRKFWLFIHFDTLNALSTSILQALNVFYWPPLIHYQKENLTRGIIRWRSVSESVSESVSQWVS